MSEIVEEIRSTTKYYSIKDNLSGCYNPAFPGENDECAVRSIAGNIIRLNKIEYKDKDLYFLFEVDDKTGLVISKPDDKHLVKTCLEIFAMYSEDSNHEKLN